MSDGRFVLNRVYLHRGANDPRLLTIPPSWRQFQRVLCNNTQHPTNPEFKATLNASCVALCMASHAHVIAPL